MAGLYTTVSHARSVLLARYLRDDSIHHWGHGWRGSAGAGAGRVEWTSQWANAFRHFRSAPAMRMPGAC